MGSEIYCAPVAQCRSGPADGMSHLQTPGPRRVAMTVPEQPPMGLEGDGRERQKAPKSPASMPEMVMTIVALVCAGAWRKSSDMGPRRAWQQMPGGREGQVAMSVVGMLVGPRERVVMMMETGEMGERARRPWET